LGKAQRPSLAPTADTAGRFPVPIPAGLFRTLLRHSSFVRAVGVDALVRLCAAVDKQWSSLPRQFCQWFDGLLPHIRRRVLQGVHQRHRRAMIAAPCRRASSRASLTLVMCCSIISFYGRPRMNIRLGRIHQRRSIRDSIPVVHVAKCCPWHQRTLRPCRIHRPYPHLRP
jgi:hypothetical protein